jgi:hypothetical protein
MAISLCWQEPNVAARMQFHDGANRLLDRRDGTVNVEVHLTAGDLCSKVAFGSDLPSTLWAFRAGLMAI